MDTEPIRLFLSTTALDIGIKILAAIIRSVGRWIINRVVAVVRAGMNRRPGRPTLTQYLGSIVAVTLNIALVIGILGYFGVQTTSFAALLAAAGGDRRGVGGMLGNFAAGAFMLVLRPFKVGDFVSVGGVTGTVHELGLFGTTLITPDHVLTTVGNGKVLGDTIENFTALHPSRRSHRATGRATGRRRRDRAFARGARDDRERGTSPAPQVNLLDTNLIGAVLAVRPYTHTDHYWQVYFDTNEAITRVDGEARLARADAGFEHAERRQSLDRRIRRPPLIDRRAPPRALTIFRQP